MKEKIFKICITDTKRSEWQGVIYTESEEKKSFQSILGLLSAMDKILLDDRLVSVDTKEIPESSA